MVELSHMAEPDCRELGVIQRRCVRAGAADLSPQPIFMMYRIQFVPSP